MYQRVGKAAYKVDLSNALALSAYLKEPQEHFKSIHVAGTNGKGSSCHMLASIFQEAEYRVGLYTSPHLKDFRERIKINGEMIPKRSVSAFVNKHQAFFEENQLSFFEMTVGLAFDYFRKEKVDIAIIETGLGGRLDSTNIIKPVLALITNIGMDHTMFLGDTLAKIATEKAGVIKKGIPVVIGETLPETKTIFMEKAKKIGAPITFAEEHKTSVFPSDLKGDYQENNIRAVQVAVGVLQKKGWAIGIQHMAKGLKNVVGNTGLLGRWQILQEAPKVICDTGHNKEGLTLVMKQLGFEHYDELHIVLGMVDDKELDSVLGLFPKEAKYYFCKANIVRGMEADILAEKAKEFDLNGLVFSSVSEAYKSALKMATSRDLIYVGGSTFIVAEVL